MTESCLLVSQFPILVFKALNILFQKIIPSPRKPQSVRQSLVQIEGLVSSPELTHPRPDHLPQQRTDFLVTCREKCLLF